MYCRVPTVPALERVGRLEHAGPIRVWLCTNPSSRLAGPMTPTVMMLDEQALHPLEQLTGLKTKSTKPPGAGLARELAALGFAMASTHNMGNSTRRRPLAIPTRIH